MPSSPRTVLFLCTGNYYRSRFAAVLFNHLAARERLDWTASSRGLKIGWPGNLGAMSKYTEQRLNELGMNCDDHRHMPLQCRPCDLEQASLAIALKEAEHRPMLEKHYNGWANRVTYWHVHDLDGASPVEALAEIEQLVTQLVEQLKRENAPR